ncbi:MAG: hypothetical protein GC190_14435 [Alphaproteobacteria bacterium]|nr:hypothetical protein [Alphaproteobacteria bacterium]
MALRPNLLRLLAALSASLSITACSAVDHAIVSTENGASRIFTSDPAEAPPPPIDMKSLNWKNLNATSPTQFALVDADQPSTTASRVVLKVPAGEAVPAFWQDAPGSYTVLSGTFVAETMDRDGRPQHLMQGPGTTVSVPARMIQKFSSTAAGESTMLLTVQGPWQPNFVDGAPTRHAAN